MPRNQSLRDVPVSRGIASSQRNTSVLPDPGPSRREIFKPLDPYWQSDLTNPLRRIGFYLAVVFVFFRFSLIHELFSFKAGFDTHLMLLLGPPTIILTMITGGFRRTLRGKLPYYWIGFTLWLIIAVPFSSWRGGSFTLVWGFIKASFPILFVIGGMVMTWKECKLMMQAIALAAIVNVLSGHWFQSMDGERLKLEFGSIGNSNDYAAHVLLILPFVLFVFLTPGRSMLVRIGSAIGMAYGLYLIASAGSRGALLSIAAICCFVLLRGTLFQRIGLIAIVSLLTLVTIALLPQRTLARYATLFTSQDNSIQDKEAMDSKMTREYLLRTSIQFTLQHPLFGVGPGEFSDSEGGTAQKEGKHGAWQVAHNSYTEVSSEAGIPALLLMIAALVSTYLTLNKVYRAARDRPAYKALATAAFCVQISLVGFCTGIMFLSLVYNFYLFAIGGITMALFSAAQAEFGDGTLRPAAVRS